MPRPRIAVRKVREILRLAWGEGLSHRESAARSGSPSPPSPTTYGRPGRPGSPGRSPTTSTTLPSRRCCSRRSPPRRPTVGRCRTGPRSATSSAAQTSGSDRRRSKQAGHDAAHGHRAGMHEMRRRPLVVSRPVSESSWRRTVLAARRPSSPAPSSLAEVVRVGELDRDRDPAVPRRGTRSAVHPAGMGRVSTSLARQRSGRGVDRPSDHRLRTELTGSVAGGRNRGGRRDGWG